MGHCISQRIRAPQIRLLKSVSLCAPQNFVPLQICQLQKDQQTLKKFLCNGVILDPNHYRQSIMNISAFFPAVVHEIVYIKYVTCFLIQ